MKRVIILFLILVAAVAAVFLFNPTGRLSSLLTDSGEVADIEHGYKTADESEMLTMLESNEIDSAALDDMFFTEDELKDILGSVEEANAFVSNTIFYEYYFEKWCLIEGFDEDGNPNDHWGWIKGYDIDSVVITNEDTEAEHKVYWQPIYVLASMASMYNGSFGNWKDDWAGKLLPADRIKKEDLENAIRVFNYEYYYLWDGARTDKTFYTWSELENISYRYKETGDFDYQPPEGEEYYRESRKIPATSIKNVLNAPEQFSYQFIKNTQCTKIYQMPDNYEIDYRIWDVDIDLLTRACQLVAPNFEWEWFFRMLEMLPGNEECYKLYEDYYKMYEEGAYSTVDEYDIPQRKVIVGDRLSRLLEHPELELNELFDLYEWDGELMFPCPDMTRISDKFGYRWHPILNEWRMHNGLDIAAPLGSQILSIADGVVEVADYSTSAGNYIVINHGNGLKSVYMHAQEIYVGVGDIVNKGSQIAAVGSTGRSTGPHLHLGVMINGSYVDPESYFTGEL